MMKDTPSLSVIIPIYNEKDGIDKAFAEIDSFLNQNVRDYEILVIESGSTDGSYELCDKMTKASPRIRVIHEGARNGFGSAVRLGFKEAAKELFLVLTIDLPYSLETINQGMNLINEYDCVLSYRSKDNRCLLRRIQSIVYNALIKTVLGLPFRKVNSAFKLLKRHCVEGSAFVSKGWLIDAEILSLISEKRMSYVEIPVTLVERSVGESSVSLIASIGVLKELWSFLKSKRKRAGLDRMWRNHH
jgi:glycosyltransferase involved in cell wall biosynthesis